MTGGRRHDHAIDFWLIFVFLIGPLSYLRFDILPAVLAGGALLAARRRPWITGALTGLGAAIKLWPALLIPAFLSYKPDRRSRPRLGVRGRRVRSRAGQPDLRRLVAADLAADLAVRPRPADRVHLGHAADDRPRRSGPSGWVVDISKYQAYEIFGPGVGTWADRSARWPPLLGLAMIVALCVRAFRAGGVDPDRHRLGGLSTVAIMIVTNKTLSPQYLLWLGGPMAALLLLRPDGSDDGRRGGDRRMSGQLLVLAPAHPPGLPAALRRLPRPPGSRDDHRVATLVTALRNLALVLFTVECCRYAWRILGPLRAAT